MDEARILHPSSLAEVKTRPVDLPASAPRPPPASAENKSWHILGARFHVGGSGGGAPSFRFDLQRPPSFSFSSSSAAFARLADTLNSEGIHIEDDVIDISND
jgi:hypothetical protein